MNRLFWKILGGIWLVLILTAVGSGYVVHWYHQAAQKNQPSRLSPADFMTGMMATVIRHEGEAGVKRLLTDCANSHCPPILVFDPQGHELLGRNIPPGPHEHPEQMKATLATAPDGQVFKIIDAGPTPRGFPGEMLNFGPPPSAPPGPAGLPPFPAIHILVALITSLVFSTAFAWYLTRPLLQLRTASRQLAAGQLSTRVLPLLEGRRDEIAALGKDFDYMAARLQALVSAQTQLLHDVSHELRSPLTRLRLAIGLAQQQPEKFEAAIERIEKEGERLDILLGKMLTLSRIDAGFHGDKTSLNLTELLLETIQDADFEAQSHGKQIEFLGHEEIGVHGYPELIHRVLENIIRNAVKYTADASTVSVSLDTENGHAHIRVRDHGPGVPEDELDKLFTPFFRSRSTADKADGYGLGLAIAKRAVNIHGGGITIFNHPAGGLLVDISLPIDATH